MRSKGIYLRNPISQNFTKKSQKWLHEMIRFLKIFKILAFSLCQRQQKRTRFKAIWPEFSNPQFSFPRPPYGRPQETTQCISGEGAPKKVSFFSVFHFFCWKFLIFFKVPSFFIPKTVPFAGNCKFFN